MKRRGQFLITAALIFFLMACHTNQKDKEEEVNFPEFLQKFNSFHVPFSFNEDSLSHPIPDSAALVYKKTVGLIPDSIWYPQGKKHAAAKIFPLGKTAYKKLQLLLICAGHGSSRKVMLLVYDKNDTLVTAHELMERGSTANDKWSFDLDKNYLLRLHERKNLPNGEMIRREQVYSINDDGSLSLIMTNTNEPANPDNFYNPIEKLPHKQHYSGDYSSGKADVVSIRDGEKKGTFRFFIHLNKNKGDCTGEIDGVGKFEHASVGIYKEEGGPCAIQFNFSGNKVTIKEVGGCGAYRGISCNFTGTYTKKKGSRSK